MKDSCKPRNTKIDLHIRSFYPMTISQFIIDIFNQFDLFTIIHSPLEHYLFEIYTLEGYDSSAPYFLSLDPESLFSWPYTICWIPPTFPTDATDQRRLDLHLRLFNLAPRSFISSIGTRKHIWWFQGVMGRDSMVHIDCWSQLGYKGSIELVQGGDDWDFSLFNQSERWHRG